MHVQFTSNLHKYQKDMVKKSIVLWEHVQMKVGRGKKREREDSRAHDIASLPVLHHITGARSDGVRIWSARGRIVINLIALLLPSLDLSYPRCNKSVRGKEVFDTFKNVLDILRGLRLSTVRCVILMFFIETQKKKKHHHPGIFLFHVFIIRRNFPKDFTVNCLQLLSYHTLTQSFNFLKYSWWVRNA